MSSNQSSSRKIPPVRAVATDNKNNTAPKGLYRVQLFFVALFFIAVSGAGVLNLVFHTDAAFSKSEMRALAQAPVPKFADLIEGNFTSQIEEFLKDQFFLRGKLLAVNNRLDGLRGIRPAKYKISKDSPRLPFAYYVEGSACVRSYVRVKSKEDNYIRVLTEFADNFPDLKIYSMIVPSSMEVAAPSIKRLSDDSRLSISYIRSQFEAEDSKIKFIDIFPNLEKTAPWEFYFRTDHHWNGEGSFAGYSAFLEQTGGSPFSNSDFRKTVIDGFVGTHYGNTASRALRDSPDQIIIYEPLYPLTMHRFAYADDNISVLDPVDTAAGLGLSGGEANYAVYLGGDYSLSIIKRAQEYAGTGDGKILVIKDSFGNPLSGLLINSYSEVHVVDPRSFVGSVGDYAIENGITDVLFVNMDSIISFAKDDLIEKVTNPDKFNIKWRDYGRGLSQNTAPAGRSADFAGRSAECSGRSFFVEEAVNGFF